MCDRGSLAVGPAHRNRRIGHGPQAERIGDFTNARKIQIDALGMHRLVQLEPFGKGAHP